MGERVLVVDDYEDTVALLAAELSAAAYEVFATTSANEALSVAIATKPDVIVMDIAMPEMDGCELARLLRSYAVTRGIRLIAISAYAYDFIEHRSPPGGWDAYVQKPLEPGTLRALVRTVLATETTSVNRTGPVAIPTLVRKSTGSTDDEGT